MLSPQISVLVGFLILSGVMTYLWFRQKRTGNAGVVDVAWAFSFGLFAIFYCLTVGGLWERKLFVSALVCIWSFRLGSYLYSRVAGKDEDTRYAGLREDWGENFETWLFYFFIFQALVASALSVCFLVPMFVEEPLFRGSDLLGALILIVSVAGEGLADLQLKAFKKDPSHRGQVCKQGLWRYSRHPNYFFEWIHWWAYIPLACGTSYWWLTLIGPVSMFFFITKMTGIPATEERSVVNRGQAYIDYQNETNAFFPWFPRIKEEDK